MDKEQEDFIKTLQKNVAFQLSLTSKELFHSNFLAWLAEDKDTIGVFKELLQNCFGAEDLLSDESKDIIVKREYMNFDFCICDNEAPNKVRFVLENKFKSLPYKEQLEEYQEKIETSNKDSEIETSNKDSEPVHYCLLSLAQGYKDFGDWKVVTYEEYTEALRNANASKNNNSFKKQLINTYCDFIKTFSDHINESLKEVCDKDIVNPEAKWDVLTNHQEFCEIRCNDVWQKIVMQHCAKVLASKIKEVFGVEAIMAHSDKDIWQKKGTENQGKFFTMVNYFHGEAFLELKYLLPGKGILAFQQQGNHPLRIGFLAMSKKYIVTTPKKKKPKEWQNKVVKYINECGLQDFIKLKERPKKKGINTYKSFGSFYYDDLNDEVTSIEQTLDDMVTTLKRFIDSRKSSSKN